ncbi:hypothetical protein ANN_27850 [Periplaneta americana]|uniref:Uncharacterized protein n=1 Tax=Periplaneta americana TaxID=6978 RepID=A0ABQ8RVA9_PERAM|nr:hypothetical protein ANN_27850 [Periplaneta americana]
MVRVEKVIKVEVTTEESEALSESSCVVPGCKSNYASSIKTEGYVRSFKFPKQIALREEWIRAIPRASWKPNDRSIVCIKHFRDSDLITVEKYVDKDGKQCERVLGTPILSESAVPKLFPGLPSYLSINESVKRKSPEERRKEVEKRLKTAEEDEKRRVEEENKVTSYENFLLNVRSKVLSYSQDWRVHTTDSVCMLYKLDFTTIPKVGSSIRINKDLTTEVHVNGGIMPNASVLTDNKLIFRNSVLSEWSQLQEAFKYSDNFHDVINNDKSFLINLIDKLFEKLKFVLENVVVQHKFNADTPGFELGLTACKVSVLYFKLHLTATWNTDWNEMPHMKCTVPENCLINNGVKQSTPEPLIYHQFVRKGNNVESKPDIQSDERSFKCDVCGELLQSAQSLEMHMRTHTTERTYDCDTCGKYFLRYSNLLTHLSRRNCDKPYRCDVCGKIFAKHKCLTVHARTHSVEKPFKCDVCGKSFAQSGDLIVHIRRHSGERPFKCSVCGKSFVHSGYVTIHERTHSGEKPFKCDICGKRFVHSSASRVHARTHTGEKPYKCNVCGKCFATSHQLTIHLRTHSGEKPFMCHICGKCFIQSSALTLHSRTHSGEKPHKCNVCGKCFASWSEVRVHARSHTGEKPYKCDICGKCFVTSSDLTVHSQTTISIWSEIRGGSKARLQKRKSNQSLIANQLMSDLFDCSLRCTNVNVQSTCFDLLIADLRKKCILQQRYLATTANLMLFKSSETNASSFNNVKIVLQDGDIGFVTNLSIYYTVIRK